MGEIQTLDRNNWPETKTRRRATAISRSAWLDGMGAGGGQCGAWPGDGLMGRPKDMKEPDPRNPEQRQHACSSRRRSSRTTPSRARKLPMAAGQRHTNEKGGRENAEPVFTLPENSTSVGSRSMTARCWAACRSTAR
ncbi:hypothetical protein M8494_36290 [Serratia ureilytica]